MQTTWPEPSIIFEDKDVLVLDKPAGIAVHADSRTQERTLADWIAEKYPETKGVGESLGDIVRPGIVHRLDKDTSGVLIVAKNNKTYEFLKKQFQDRLVGKKYLALVWGNVKEDEGVVDRPIGKSAKDFRQRSATSNARGTLREAETHWKVKERFGNYTLLEVTPKTGRTHQIRVHLKAVSHPIVCDKLYASGRECPIGILARQGLHAKSLRIKLPSGVERTFEAPIPDDFAGLLEELRRL